VRAVVITEPGGPDVLRCTDVPDPAPGPGEVLIDVVASGVNRADIAQRQGFYPPPPGASPYPGLEVAGHISSLGPHVTGWSVGDEVCALLAGGGYAERATAPASCLLPIPPGVPLADAAALPEVACTGWSNLIDVAGLRAGDTLLVHGGSSGIGTFAIQFAVALGVTVYATARSSKLDALRALGAVPIDYERDDFAALVQADVVFDIIGAAYLARNIAALKVGGRLVIIGLQGGRKAELDLGALLAKRGTIVATTLRNRPLDEKAAIVRGVRDDVWPLVAGGQVRPIIHTRLPLREAAEAHRIVEASTHVGKVLLLN
jgi:putative PIG3 family NAD(P)H quinone oxidoreductase